jgi:hypothetical protein
MTTGRGTRREQHTRVAGSTYHITRHQLRFPAPATRAVRLPRIVSILPVIQVVVRVALPLRGSTMEIVRDDETRLAGRASGKSGRLAVKDRGSEKSLKWILPRIPPLNSLPIS